ncbi:hypothetical protein NLG97_g955 [Lecanicillium saksenae]|uniref:Uncharacterized protein n=1 Tax=Lecanicillium saksenae TaxID=468837 RepID=A0ACC1R7S4_9HYPO|nr:hypothetical protein NLG97_g955 [Lecanicillium saksenae]
MRIASCLYVASHLAVGFALARGGRHDSLAMKREQAAKRDQSSKVWCGAVKTADKVNVVEGTWIVPSISLPKGATGEKEYWSYQWVGIDGDTSSCQVLLQGGTGQTIIDGEVNTFGWYEFYPDPPVYAGMIIATNDTVYTKVEATSSTTGKITIENVTTGEKKSFEVESKNGPLCQGSADWIQEFPVLPYAEFSDFSITNCSASTEGGRSLNLAGSENWYVPDGKGGKLCYATENSDTSVALHYNGN